MDYEKLSRIRVAILSFFKLCDEFPEQEFYEAWVKTLDAVRQHQLHQIGFKEGKQLVSFQCYYMEQNGYFIYDFLKGRLSQDDFKYCLNLGGLLS